MATTSLSCGRVYRGADPRCPGCARIHQRQRDQLHGTAAQRGYGSAWRTLQLGQRRHDPAPGGAGRRRNANRPTDPRPAFRERQSQERNGPARNHWASYVCLSLGWGPGRIPPQFRAAPGAHTSRLTRRGT
jgi:hypothetical protein